MKCDRKKLLVYAMFIILVIFGILFLINYKSTDDGKEEEDSLIEGAKTMDPELIKYLETGGTATHNLVKRRHAIVRSRGKQNVSYGTAANAAIGFPEFSSIVEGFKEGAATATTSEKTDPTIGDTCATRDEDGSCLSEKNKKCKSLDDDFLKGDPNVCKKLAQDEYKFCGICVKPEQGLAVSAPGSTKGGMASVPISCIPEKNWISPGKNIVYECEKALERIKCAKVKKCDLSDVGDAKNLCAWCPIEGKAFVYNKNHLKKWRKSNGRYYSRKKLNNGKTITQRGEYIPKYPNLDTCDWGNIKGKPAWLGWGKKRGFSGPLIRSLSDCRRLDADFPCLKDPTKIKTGKHSTACKQDMWESTNCSGNYESRLKHLRNKKLSYVKNNERKNENTIKSSLDTYGMSFLDVFKEMDHNSKKVVSKDYDEANFHKNLCYGSDWDSCDDRFKDSNRKNRDGRSDPKYRPKQCLDKLWKASGCTDGRYNPNNVKNFHDKKKLSGSNDYAYIMHKLPSSQLGKAFKNMKRWADQTNTNINENILEGNPNYTDYAIFWQEACYGKILPKTKNLIKDKKPKCFKDFQHRIGNAHNVSKPSGKLNFKADSQIREQSRYRDRVYKTKVGDKYMSNDYERRAIMNNKSPVGRDWGPKKEVTKKMYDQEFFPYWKFRKASRVHYKKPSWDQFRMLLAGDGKTFEDFVKDEVKKKTPVELRNKRALANYNSNKIWGITGVSSPDPDTIQMDKLTDFTAIMNAYKVNPTWKLSRPINGKCQSCSIVPCGQCQAGCPRSECPDGRSRNHCGGNNVGQRPSRCDIPKSNIITRDMYGDGYMDGGERKEFPYWEFMKIARRMGQKPF